jgi:hypothetical protein
MTSWSIRQTGLMPMTEFASGNSLQQVNPTKLPASGQVPFAEVCRAPEPANDRQKLVHPILLGVAGNAGKIPSAAGKKHALQGGRTGPGWG